MAVAAPRPLIASLLGSGGPAAVIGAVRPVIVLAVHGVSRARGVAKVREVCLKAGRAEPTIANVDAAPAVVFVSSRVRVVAARDHGSPNQVARRSSQPVDLVRRANEFWQASAALRCATPQDAGRDHVRPAAVTRAQPPRDTLAFGAHVIFGTRLNDEPPKSLTDNALSWLSHCILSTWITITNSTVLEPSDSLKRGLIYGS